MSRPLRPLPDHLHDRIFTLADLRAAGFARSRTRARDVERVGHGLYRHRDSGTRMPRPAEDAAIAAVLGAVPLGAAPLSTPLPPVLSERIRALQLKHPDLVLSHLSAAQVHGFPLPDGIFGADAVHASTARSHRPRAAWVRTHRRPLAADHVVTRRGLRCTSPIRTLWDLCAPGMGLRLEQLVVIADSLMPQEWIEGYGLAEIRTTREHLDAVRRQLGPFRGCQRAAEVSALMREAVGSPQETRTRLALLAAGLPQPDVAHLLRTPSGETGPRVDLAYPQWRIVIQYEGAVHRTRQQQERDVRRDRWCEAHGWLVIKVTARDLANGLVDVLPLIRGRIAAMG